MGAVKRFRDRRSSGQGDWQSRPSMPGLHHADFDRPASQSCGLGSLPNHPAVQQPQAVVGEAAEAVPDTLDLLDEQVDGLGGAVGAAPGRVEGQDFGLPGPDRAGQAYQLATLTPSDQR
jgi:hypothetical protein